jgi:hypothetical protein
MFSTFLDTSFYTVYIDIVLYTASVFNSISKYKAKANMHMYLKKAKMSYNLELREY